MISSNSNFCHNIKLRKSEDVSSFYISSDCVCEAVISLNDKLTDIQSICSILVISLMLIITGKFASQSLPCNLFVKETDLHADVLFKVSLIQKAKRVVCRGDSHLLNIPVKCGWVEPQLFYNEKPA